MLVVDKSTFLHSFCKTISAPGNETLLEKALEALCMKHVFKTVEFGPSTFAALARTALANMQSQLVTTNHAPKCGIILKDERDAITDPDRELDFRHIRVLQAAMETVGLKCLLHPIKRFAAGNLPKDAVNISVSSCGSGMPKFGCEIDVPVAAPEKRLDALETVEARLREKEAALRSENAGLIKTLVAVRADGAKLAEAVEKERSRAVALQADLDRLRATVFEAKENYDAIREAHKASLRETEACEKRIKQSREKAAKAKEVADAQLSELARLREEEKRRAHILKDLSAEAEKADAAIRLAEDARSSRDDAEDESRAASAEMRGALAQRNQARAWLAYLWADHDETKKTCVALGNALTNLREQAALADADLRAKRWMLHEFVRERDDKAADLQAVRREIADLECSMFDARVELDIARARACAIV